MKKITRSFLVVMLLLLGITFHANAQCYSPTYSGGTNQVANPSFDGDFASQTGWTKGWTNFDPKSTENSCIDDTTGSLYLKGNCYPNGGVLEYNSGIPIVAGHRYRIIASIKNETAASNAFNFHLPSNIWDLADTNNHSSATYLVGIPQTTGWTTFDQTIMAGSNASGNVQFLFMSCDGFVNSAETDFIYLDNLEIYDIDASLPTITVSKSKLSFNESNTQLTFEVTGNNLNQNITLTPPTGITLDVTTISYATASTPTTITATWDTNANIINQNINITSDSTSKLVNIIASIDSGCFTPLNATLNLISDPTMMDRSNYGGWGNVAVAINQDGACGATSALMTVTSTGKYGDGGAAFDINNITYEPNTQYGIQFKIKTVGGYVALKLIDGDATFDDNSSNLLEINTSDTWVTGSYQFTTGANVGNLAITFNSADLVTNTTFATEVHLDNLELYNMSTLSTNTPGKNNLSFKVSPNPVTDILNINTNLKISKVTVYDLLGRTVIPNITLGDSKSIDVSSLNSGTYILRATIEGKTQVIKFIK
ncbi:T9SS type A sorting domain-containing protein [Aestuariibaculum suncheonense]|uniref:T9SS type A sorting domain-containing protein n=1 Tax=Aestuariibaculum suncheonense TaxID=1028745 RepID=A0A8J6UAW8_9FLAO|nr:T9SS type A sorting domain-containing protein [Aestuariibaculum suncheonense]MBD0834842.1 T9SS type A sorting domain-containing protein [Aestuariibaculum suncheonense]